MDRLLLYELTSVLDRTPGGVRVSVIDDTTGALALAAAELSGRPVAVVCDSWQDEQRVRAAEAAHGRATGGSGEASAHVTTSPEEAVGRLTSSGEPTGPLPLVLARLPKGLAGLDELGEVVAAHAPPDVLLLVGARDKFLAPSMNDVLRRHFSDVRATRGHQKCRALVAEGPLHKPPTYPRRQHHRDLDLAVFAHGAAFAGTKVDRATRLLLSAFDRLPPLPDRIIDLGCGTGILAALAARRRPLAQVLALDDSRAAIRSTQATLVANGLADRVSVRREDGLAGEVDASADLILCNPPFHRGTRKDSTTAFAMITEAARVLRPEGELWLVYNAHLPYLPALRRRVGPTSILLRDREYLVTRSVRLRPRPLTHPGTGRQ